VKRLPGLTLEVSEACVSCGACADACYVHAVAMDNGRASIDLGQCKGCGRCITVCPTSAISLHVDENVDMLDQMLARIAQRTHIGHTSEQARMR
jgi:ferredoxin